MFVYRDGMKKAHLLGFTFAFTMSLMFFTYATVFYFGAWLIKNDNLSFDNMFK